MISFQEDTWEWQEYKLIQQNGNTILWLSIEEVEGKTKYSIYNVYAGSRVNQEMNIVIGGEQYSLYEKGSAIVKNYYGNVDVDIRERVNFVEYISNSKEKLFSIEYWDGEIEQTIGRFIEPPNIVITNEVETSQIRNQIGVKKGGSIFSAVFLGFFSLVFVFIFFLATIGSNKSISKYLKNSSSYTYVTSVTNNSNNKKADVYKSSKTTIDETVKDIINGVPEKITKVSENVEAEDQDLNTLENLEESSISENENGVGLITNSEYAYVYEGDDNSIYVQVSKKSYVNSSSTVYHSRSHRHYYRTYTTPSSSSSYDSYLSSARQSSINSRRSSGGGTSSGK